MRKRFVYIKKKKKPESSLSQNVVIVKIPTKCSPEIFVIWVANRTSVISLLCNSETEVYTLPVL